MLLRKIWVRIGLAMKSRILALIIGIQVLAACAGPRMTATDPNISLTNLDELPAPVGNMTSVVQPGDNVTISVLGAEQLTGEYYIDASGMLDFPLIGAVPVAGRTPSQVAQAIADQLRGRYVNNPEVNVIPSELAQATISVGGQVKRPGSYPSRSSNSLVRAVNNAGGMTDYAKVEDVLVLRRVGDEQYVGVYNINAIQRGNYPDPAIYPDDIITVGDSPARRRLATILQFVPLISSSVLVFDRLAN